MSTDSFSSYSLNTVVRQSGNTEVSRGHRRSDGASVVVKVLRNEYPSAVELAKLKQEYSILRSLQLETVVRALDLQSLGRGLALVLEDAGDVSLHSLIQAGRLDLRRALEYSVAITSAVASVHASGIIHRDIKPQHFIVNPDEPSSVVLVDFGLATRLAVHAGQGEPVTQLEGSLAYIAPEQTGRMNRIIDQRSDLYSLGATLYELFTGRLPFAAKDALELVHSHIARTPPAPHELDQDIPRVLSDIILRLLSKAAEDRYQSANGLLADLKRCLSGLSSDGKLKPFPLAEADAPGELRVPQKLYGRRAELELLRAHLQRVKDGGTELLLLSGSSGVGKTALVAELRQQMARGGYIVSGKFDHVARGIPYAPLVHVCRQLVDSLLAEPTAILAQRRRTLLEALGNNGKLIIDLVPNLEKVIGTQPDVPPLGPDESVNRFELALQAFLGVFRAAGRPLVVFLDDVHWADLASLRLIELLLNRMGPGYLLMVAAYRDNEVDTTHPLVLAVDRWREAGIAMTELNVQPLQPSHVAELLADTLNATQEETSTLAEPLYSKTRGNPFYIQEVLRAFRKNGLLAFNPELRRWEWDVASVHESLVAENVAAFMLTRLDDLSPEAKVVLRIAACVGHQFDSPTLMAVSDISESELGRSLWETLREGMIVPLDSNYRYTAEAVDSGSSATESALDARYQFAHDRVQQAAYDSVSDDEKVRLHFRIGQLLLARTDNDPVDDDLFTIVDHLNRGMELITEAVEKKRLAQLNLLAGQRARDAAAPASASQYLATALSLSQDDPWATDYKFSLNAHLLSAECEYLSGDSEQAFHWLDQIEEHATAIQDQLLGRNLRMVVLVSSGQIVRACEQTVDTARLLGVELPSPDDKAALGAAIGAEFGVCQQAIAGRTVELLAELPAMTDARHLAVLGTLVAGFPAAFQGNQELFALLTLKAAALSLQRGIASVSPLVFAQYAIVRHMVTGDAATSYRFGKLAIDLSQRLEKCAVGGAVHFIFGGFLCHWRDHVSGAIESLRLGLPLSLEYGDRLHAAYCASVALHYRVYAGESLDDIEASIDGALNLAQRTGDVVNVAFCTVCRRMIAALQGRTTSPTSLSGEGFDEAEIEQAPYSAQTFAATAKTMVRYLAGDYRGAVDAADALSPLPGNYFHGEHELYRALALVELARTAEDGERAQLIERINGAAELLRGWAESAPANHAARHSLVLAEIAALAGNVADALDAYERAIALAHENRFTNQEAVANELCGRFHLRCGRTKAARPYLQDAYYCYQRWGATAKLDQLKAEHAQVVPFDTAPTRDPKNTSLDTVRDLDTTHTTTTYGGGTLDLATAIRATETIVTELAHDRLLERLMRTLLESAGALKCLFFSKHGDALRLEAKASLEPDVVQLNIGTDLADCNDAPRSIVQYVARTSETLVLGDATRDNRSASDPYVLHGNLKSLLCIPMVHRGTLTGVMYLENSLVLDAFSPKRIELLQFLAAQAAAAIENSKLYNELSAVTEQLRRTNETLEGRVTARTNELRRALAELWSEMDLARKIQTVLLPPEPKLPDYDIFAAMIPADQVGGDYYDVVPDGNGGGWVLVGDVSGHGVVAGLIMMMVQSAIRTVVCETPGAGAALSPAAVLSRVNASLWTNLQQVGDGHYMTASALRIDGKTIHYAGLHQDILVYRAASRRVERIETTGIWIGLTANIAALLEDRSLELDPGDVVLLYSDGITEFSEGGTMLGTQGLVSRFQELAAQSTAPGAIVQGIIGQVAGRKLEDDVTVLAMRYQPEV